MAFGDGRETARLMRGYIAMELVRLCDVVHRVDHVFCAAVEASATTGTDIGKGMGG
mgnify:CR=1 FL=1